MEKQSKSLAFSLFLILVTIELSFGPSNVLNMFVLVGGFLYLLWKKQWGVIGATIIVAPMTPHCFFQSRYKNPTTNTKLFKTFEGTNDNSIVTNIRKREKAKLLDCFSILNPPLFVMSAH